MSYVIEVLKRINTETFFFKKPNKEWLKMFCKRNYCRWKIPILEQLINNCSENKIHLLLGSNSFDYIILGMADDNTTLKLYPGYLFPENNEDYNLEEICGAINRIKSEIEKLVPKGYKVDVMPVISQMKSGGSEFEETVTDNNILPLKIWQTQIDKSKDVLNLNKIEDTEFIQTIDDFLHSLDSCGGENLVYSENFNAQLKFVDRYLHESFTNFLEKLSPALTYCYNEEGGVSKLIRDDDQGLIDYYSGQLSTSNLCAVLNIDHSQVCNDLKEPLLKEFTGELAGRCDIEEVKKHFYDKFTHTSMDDKVYADIFSKIDNIELEDLMKKLRVIEKSDVVRKMRLADLALNSAFVGDSPAVINRSMDAFIGYIKYICGKDIGVKNITISDINQTEDAKSDDGITKAFENATADTLIIVNELDKLVAHVFEQDYNKSKIEYKLKAFFNAFDKGVEATVLCTASQEGWKKLLALYPSLKVIFQNVFIFEKPSPDKLTEYFNQLLEKEGYSISEEASKYCRKYFEYVHKTSALGNLYFTICDSLLDEAKRYQLYRLATSDNDSREMKKIELPDIQQALADEFKPYHEEKLEDIMRELDTMTGLQSIKENIKNLAALAKVQYLRINKNIEVDSTFSLHSIFYGNPGSGKTTVAHLIGRIYKSIGLLPLGNVVSVKRSDIVSYWVGGTARLVKQTINEARGGVLFIDEAYDLARKGDSGKDSGLEAINTLVSEMEYINKDTCVILAGYPDEMDHLLKSNPGLSSRFVNKFHFQDYSANELGLIFMDMIEKHNYKISDTAIKSINRYLEKLVIEKDKHFGNARMCRTLLQKLKVIHARRVLDECKDSLSVDELQLFTKEDVKELIDSFKTDIKTNDREKAAIGFTPANNT